MEKEVNTIQPIFTLYDAVTDSPVFRTNVYRYDQQLEHLEHWLDSFSRQLKLYTEKLNKLNFETELVCQKAIPEGLDETLLDPHFTGGVMKCFSETLQSSLTFKAKLISSLEESLISPLQQFVKTNLKDFKNFRKLHEKALDRYESQLAKYSALSKSKEPSAIREEAFRLFEARKNYVRLSGQQVLRVLNFRSSLEHCLIERFSAATIAHKEFYSDVQVWANLDAAIAYWKEWLVDDKATCLYQLSKQQIARKRLEDEYLNLSAPDHSLTKYVPPSPMDANKIDFSHSKWGYLFVRISRHNWVRRWVYLHGGYIGKCHIDVSSKHKPTITRESKIRLEDCEISTSPDTDRRFCFEITQTKQQIATILQAETEEEMQAWISSFNTNKELVMKEKGYQSSKISNSSSSKGFSGFKRFPSIIKTKSNATTSQVSADTIINSPTKSTATSDSSSSINSNASSPSLSGSYSHLISSTSINLSNDQSPSIVMVSTTPDAEASLSNSSSLTPLLVWEAAKVEVNDASKTSVNKLPSTSWGIPLALVPAMSIVPGDEMTNFNSASSISSKSSSNGTCVIWPANPTLIDIPAVEGIAGYAEKMGKENLELRCLFGGVDSNEVVLDAFVCCLRQKPQNPPLTAKDIESSKSVVNTPIVDMYENELVHELTQKGLESPSQYGYAYTGRGFITQESFWFYSCVLMSCINSVAVRLRDIDEVSIVKDTSLKKALGSKAAEMNSDMAISITLVPGAKSDVKEPLIFGTLTDNIEAVVAKLKFAVNNAKSDEPMQIRNVFSKMQDLTNTNTSQKKIVLDMPSTFAGALTPLKSESNSSVTSTPVPKRQHASTISAGSKPQTLGAVKQQRQRGESEPMAAVVPIKSVTEPPKYVDPDMPPSHIQVPESQVECGCDDHLDKQDIQLNLPISAKRLYELMFSDEKNATPTTDGGVWNEKTAAIEGHDLSVSKWETIDGKTQRTLKYWMPVTNPIVRMKEAEVVEQQVLINKEDYIRYTVQISTKTAALPYADAFIPSVRYCITWVTASECQLTCYLGVRWVKSVLVRTIVTRAALKGMADSVGVFGPILERESQKICDSVEETRKTRKRASTLPVVSVDAVSSISISEMKSVQEEEQEASNITVAESEVDNSSLKPIVEPSKIKSVKAAVLSIEKSTSTPKSIPQIKKTLPAASTKSAEVKTTVSERPTVTKRTSKQKLSSSKQKATVSWLANLKEYAPTISWISLTTYLFLGLSVYMTWTWFWSTSKTLENATRAMNNNQMDIPQKVERKSVSRSVYLRDLEKGFLSSSIRPPYVDSQSHNVFLQSRNAMISGKDVDKSSEVIGVQWFNVEHYRLALDLEVSRERLAMLRHDMLTIFQILNKLDAQLIESEYTNWLLDTRLKCKYYPKLSDEDPRSENRSNLCNDVKLQLHKLF